MNVILSCAMPLRLLFGVLQPQGRTEESASVQLLRGIFSGISRLLFFLATTDPSEHAGKA